ncbi:peptidoglycan-binding domain-containing protein [Rhizobium leguminosarum]|uniref:peptidoglycan-binding domain-containing protein n=1 Tax=Rhizobium leguminosarum TaxID=384 RepID=UPI001C94A625|nr:peptidoglycan-binding domain-containing protein [Rhizobium leguminosarum]MBY5660446.1 peptidoglycan-binding protein [Rhizobium leguminosarum]MBY5674069.1 peptidoglycan-binding protein [Rhizobium leguminosarum]
MKCTNMICIASALSLAAVCQVSTAAAQDQIHCFKADYSKGESIVRAIYVDTKDDVTIALRVWGLPDTIFVSLATCNVEAGVLRCSVECDGGTVTLVKNDQGIMFARFQALIFDGTRMRRSILDNLYDADGTELSGSFLLHAAQDQHACATETELPKQDARVLQPGDLSPDIEEIEQALTKLGYPVPNSSWVFNKELENRTKEFQTDQNLSVTGKIDPFTFERITNMARGAGGGC